MKTNDYYIRALNGAYYKRMAEHYYKRFDGVLVELPTLWTRNKNLAEILNVDQVIVLLRNLRSKGYPVIQERIK